MKKILPVIIVGFLILVGIGGYWWFQGRKASGNDVIEPPKAVKKVNDLEMSQRPYVALLPHPNPGRCSGADLIIEDLKKAETLTEYELEYMAGALIQGVFGRRDLEKTGVEHQPLEFGTCSKGKCKCDENISGGSLTLNFTTPDDEYTLKSDFSNHVVDEEPLVSPDVRLSVNVGKALPKGTEVIVMKAMGLPAEVDGEVIAGPYGIFTPKGIVAAREMNISLQTKEEGKLLFWNGKAWQELEASFEAEKLVASIPNVGMLLLVK